MPNDALTNTQARILYTMLRNASVPRVGYREFVGAVEKLRELGGGQHCRDCTEVGTIVSPHGGMVCARHA